MKLYSQQPYWLMKNGIINSYTSLKENIAVDVAVIGAGISGALAAYYLLDTDLKIAIVDRRHAGCGSTAASTAFLQYELDVPLRLLRNYIGEAKAVQCYKLCGEAIHEIESICRSLRPDFDFHTRPSMQFASYKKHKEPLYEEFGLRQKHGFEVQWREEKQLLQQFGIKAPAGMLSAVGGEIDAYMLTHALLDKVTRKGHSIYNNTGIVNISYTRNRVHLLTDTGMQITAKKLIIACGYESQKYIPKKIADIHTTYAIVSEPLTDKVFWYKNSLVWETANPYIYFRKVGGDKILVGGQDDAYHHPATRESVIKKKAGMLERAFCKRVQNMPIKADYSWSGAFAVTKDGMPYIGSIPERPNTFFALGYGGNGITFSVIAAQIIRDLLSGRKNENARLFHFNR